MKNAICAIALVAVLSSGMQAQGNKPQLAGRIKLFTSAFVADNLQGRFFSHEAGDFAVKRVEARLKVSGSLGERIGYNLRLDAYAYAGELLLRQGFPEAGFLGSPQATEHFELNLYEASVKVSRFLLPRLDLTFGKQRISWGTADKISVVDFLNPLDFANFFTFDPDYFAEKRPQSALNLEYYIGRHSKLQIVWLLQHQVSPLPFGYTFLTRTQGNFQDILVEKGWDETVGDTNFGIRFSTNALNTDLAVSYYRGNAPLPVLQGIFALPQSQATFYYPRLSAVALDLAGEIAGIGFWGEVAGFFPEDTSAFIRIPLAITDPPSGTIEKRFALFADHFFKWVLGLDYHFGRGFYANLQFLHGFFDEFSYSTDAQKAFNLRQGMFFGEPSDYLLGRLEYKNASGTWKISAGGILEMSGGRNAFAIMPELECRIADSLVLQAGGFILLSGDAQMTKFGVFKKDKLLFLGLKIDF